jgi:hypothetical protein
VRNDSGTAFASTSAQRFRTEQGEDEAPMNGQMNSDAYQDEWQMNLRKDGGRQVFYGGDPYEDDLEPEDDGPVTPSDSADLP